MNTPKHALLLALCGATIVLAAAPAGALGDQLSQPYGPGVHQFTVPPGVTSLSVTVDGAGGGLAATGNGCVPGQGAQIAGNVPVTPGQLLTVTVGGAGGDAGGATGGSGGAGGGAPGGSATSSPGYGGGGGGGRSEIEASTGPLAVAGGGGGCGGGATGTFGDGGNDGSAGQDGGAGGGGAGGASPGAGGASGPSSAPTGGSGTPLGGGAGAASSFLGGGGGGGGYPYGGGGGGGAAQGFSFAAGGGGGGDYVAPGSGLTITAGAHAGDGSVTIAWSPPGTGVGRLFVPSVIRTSMMFDTLLLDDPLHRSTSGVLPVDGVITSWAYDSGVDAPSAVELKVAQGNTTAGGDGNFKIVANAASSGSIQPGEITTWPARIPVQAGQVIGAYITGPSDFDFPGPDNTGSAVGAYGDASVGDTNEYLASNPSQYALTLPKKIGPAVPLEAFVEPDADGDGFGDISQDRCPGIAGSVQGCPLADLGVTSAAAVAGGTAVFTETVTNHGPDALPSVSLDDDPGPGARVVSAITDVGSCTFGPTAHCKLPALADHQSVTVAIVVAPGPSGRVTNTASVAGPAVPAGIGAGDLVPGNDTAVDTVTVAPATAPGGGSAPGAGPAAGGGTAPHGGTRPSGGVSARTRFPGARVRIRGTLAVHGGRVRLVLVAGPAAARGTVTVTSLSGRRLGRASFTLRAGRAGTVAVRVGRLPHHLRVRLVVASRGAGGAAATTRASARVR